MQQTKAMNRCLNPAYSKYSSAQEAIDPYFCEKNEICGGSITHVIQKWWNGGKFVLQPGIFTRPCPLKYLKSITPRCLSAWSMKPLRNHDFKLGQVPLRPTKNFKSQTLLSPSGDLGIGLVWHNLSPPTFWSHCWNPLQTELNFLWGVLSCSQDDIRWF